MTQRKFSAGVGCRRQGREIECDRLQAHLCEGKRQRHGKAGLARGTVATAALGRVRLLGSGSRGRVVLVAIGMALVHGGLGLLRRAGVVRDPNASTPTPMPGGDEAAVPPQPPMNRAARRKAAAQARTQQGA